MTEVMSTYDMDLHDIWYCDEPVSLSVEIVEGVN